MREKVVLVIDDDEMNLKIAEMILQRKVKCRVICVDNGRAGIEILHREHVDLVLLDILMPDFDGIETLTEIRADEQLKNTSVMMLTAANGIENLKKVYALGVKDYIKKPFLPADLVTRVNKKFAELDELSEKVLLLGTNTDELHAMQEVIEKNFDYEVLTADSPVNAKKILHDNNITLVIADANMKFIDGFQLLMFASNEKKLSGVPFVLTSSEKILELINKINAPAVEKVAESIVVHKDKKNLARVVTNLIGYEVDVRC